MVQSFNEVIAESQLPAYLIEGMLMEVLAETRRRKNDELLADIARMGAAKIEDAPNAPQ